MFIKVACSKKIVLYIYILLVRNLAMTCITMKLVWVYIRWLSIELFDAFCIRIISLLRGVNRSTDRRIC